MACLGFAVVGTSSISESFISVLNASDDARYVGSVSRDRERAARVTADHGGTVPFTSLDAAIACEEVDAVYIASPNALHAAQALDCVRAGKHVLVEKPLALCEADARSILDAARSAGVVAMEAMRSVHDPGMQTIRDAIARIGRVRRASLRFGKYSSRYDEVLAGRQTNIFDARMGTGSLMDIGVYCVEACVALFGAPDAVTCAPVLISGPDTEQTGGVVDGAGTILARYPDKVVELSYSKISQDLLPCQIEGELGTVTYSGVSVPLEGELLLRGRAVGGAQRPGEFSERDVTERLAFPACDNNMCYELADFIACVRGGLDAAPFGEITCTSLSIMDEARRQAGIEFPRG